MSRSHSESRERSPSSRWQPAQQLRRIRPARRGVRAKTCAKSIETVVCSSSGRLRAPVTSTGWPASRRTWRSAGPGLGPLGVLDLADDRVPVRRDRVPVRRAQRRKGGRCSRCGIQGSAQIVGHRGLRRPLVGPSPPAVGLGTFDFGESLGLHSTRRGALGDVPDVALGGERPGVSRPCVGRGRARRCAAVGDRSVVARSCRRRVPARRSSRSRERPEPPRRR